MDIDASNPEVWINFDHFALQVPLNTKIAFYDFLSTQPIWQQNNEYHHLDMMYKNRCLRIQEGEYKDFLERWRTNNILLLKVMRDWLKINAS